MTIDPDELAEKIREFCQTRKCQVGNAWECARCPLCRFHTWIEGEPVKGMNKYKYSGECLNCGVSVVVTSPDGLAPGDRCLECPNCCNLVDLEVSN